VRRSNSKLLAVALRRGWVVVIAIAAVTALATAINGARQGETVSEAVAIVPAGAGAEGPGNATQATQLAQTYVEAIPEDGAVLGYIAEQIGRSSDEVADNFTVVGNPSTSVLRLRYKDPNRERSLSAAQAALTSVTGRRPRGESVAPRSLNVVHQPRVVSETAPNSSAAIPIGIILGLGLGIVLVVGWERSDPRIDVAGELADAAGTPATALGDVAPGNIDALLERWRRLPGNGAGPQVVGLVAGTERTEAYVRPAANELARLSAAGGQLLRVGTASRPAGVADGLVIVTGGVPGGPSAGEAVAADASIVVVAVERGARVSELSGSLAVLTQFGAAPAWALFVRPGGSG
jgi:capsular polysaccharide biosynthesis protein